MPRQSNASAYDWLTAEDVVRHALAAYYSACRNADAGAAAFPDEPSYTDPADASWANSCRVGLGEQIAQDLEVRLLAHAEKQGIEWGAQRVDKFSADTPIPRVSLAFGELSPNLHRAKLRALNVDNLYKSRPWFEWEWLALQELLTIRHVFRHGLPFASCTQLVSINQPQHDDAPPFPQTA